MARKMRELLWKLREDTANEIQELQECGEISAWLQEQAEPEADRSGKDMDTAVDFPEEELSPGGLSLRTH